MLFPMGPINGMDMLLEVKADELHPSMYIKEPRRIKKLRFMELERVDKDK